MPRFLAQLLTAIALALALIGPAAAQPRPPLVLAAASLQETLNAAADLWARKGHPRPVISYAASSALARQIEAGAPPICLSRPTRSGWTTSRASGCCAPVRGRRC